MTKITAAITGVQGYVPEDILTNADLAKFVDTTDEWIVSRTGIKTRHILRGEGKGTSVMAIEAVKGLLAKTNTKPEEIDLLICATISPDHFFPATANIICEAVGIPHVGSYDLAAACSGFLNALVTGAMFIEAGRYKKVVVVGADKMSSIVDYTDRTTCVLFGDGSGAVLLEANTEGLGIQDFILKSDGSGANHLIQKAGGSAYPPTHETIDQRQHYIHQEGPAVFKFAVTRMADVSAEIMERNQLTGEDVAFLVPHQANKRIIDATANRMGIGPDKVMLTIQKYGNTTAATIPLCLWDYESQLKKGDNLILAAFGGGFTWGSIYLKWAY
ncbi:MULTISPECIES: beta-ketoacyl-ACP synthase III [unclassified Arcicella]|uniref:beta-ketoacyl-ACP synthase III n=1 Tax=unclassified Arcicella TaxID=2644986 RepID=UPI002859C6AC|nr:MULTISPECIES: beta-ketoacyl-ACP synthase III [unclassified Arcicella]MDR6560421.1 3-oxoacyl-[acyl-carrier-protein] synthase-3 [Arcicella sp. BE51]MDR6809973.1 3-oxoacyl-[acyl-carrier-protein] synthase-3 [Arcicella sp. BE140]MDR6821322.1 3-oxoacyl-[acyl-carrier-protein] synthase-3 [Arcicella sp. BE139]